MILTEKSEFNDLLRLVTGAIINTLTQLIYVHKKHVQETNNKNSSNNKSNNECKCSPKINIDHLPSPSQSFFESRVVKGKVFQCSWNSLF